MTEEHPLKSRARHRLAEVSGATGFFLVGVALYSFFDWPAVVLLVGGLLIALGVLL